MSGMEGVLGSEGAGLLDLVMTFQATFCSESQIQQAHFVHSLYSFLPSSLLSFIPSF